MAWFIRTSRSGVHAVYSQQAQNSCGIACVIMVNFKLKKWKLAVAASAASAGIVAAAPGMVMAVTDTMRSEKEVDAAYAKVTGQPYDGSTDSDARLLPQVLNQLLIGRWQTEFVPANRLADNIINRSKFSSAPFIALVHWRGGAGHFVTCDNVVTVNGTTWADFCDPWDGSVRTLALRSGESITYHAKTEPGYMDFMGQRNTYASRVTAAMDGWIVYQVNA